ncbi:hypothetical protein BKH38_05015 [Actinomyces naeslundii]|nr:hypothetical protein BKH38_05015 [Actinomyces naeslundii]
MLARRIELVEFSSQAIEIYVQLVESPSRRGELTLNELLSISPAMFVIAFYISLVVAEAASARGCDVRVWRELSKARRTVSNVEWIEKSLSLFQKDELLLVVGIL